MSARYKVEKDENAVDHKDDIYNPLNLFLAPRRSKESCPHHGWDEHGRPDPPVGYCGPKCAMRPRKLSQARGKVGE